MPSRGDINYTLLQAVTKHWWPSHLLSAQISPVLQTDSCRLPSVVPYSPQINKPQIIPVSISHPHECANRRLITTTIRCERLELVFSQILSLLSPLPLCYKCLRLPLFLFRCHFLYHWETGFSTIFQNYLGKNSILIIIFFPFVRSNLKCLLKNIIKFNH